MCSVRIMAESCTIRQVKFPIPERRKTEVCLVVAKVVHQHTEQSRDVQWFAPSRGRCKFNRQSDGINQPFVIDRKTLDQGWDVSSEQWDRASLKGE